jgi:hypothetical protein
VSAIPPVLQSELSSFMRGRMVPGLVAGLVREGRGEAWGFGRTARDVERVPDADTVFEIGSITKVFTSTLLALLVEDGRLRLEQPIHSLLEGRVALPPEAQTVTLLHLATHTATFPRASRRMMGRGLRQPSNPYRDYTVKDLYDDLAQFRPGPGLGRAFTYSNLGAGLLGHLLELATGQTYETRPSPSKTRSAPGWPRATGSANRSACGTCPSWPGQARCGPPCATSWPSWRRISACARRRWTALWRPRVSRACRPRPPSPSAWAGT